MLGRWARETVGISKSRVNVCRRHLCSLLSAPLCTPPMPPVAKKSIPAIEARCAVALTVVPPTPLFASTPAKSLLAVLTALSPLSSAVLANLSSCRASRPTWTSPSSRAMVAGVAPAPLMTDSQRWATRRLTEAGRPCVMIVDSRATSG